MKTLSDKWVASTITNKCLSCKNGKYNTTFREIECKKGFSSPLIAFSCFEKKASISVNKEKMYG